MTKIQKNIVPYNKYFIDSAKFFIDSDAFVSVNIPQNFILVDSDTGEELTNFKRSSLEIPYCHHKIYIATVKRQLKQMSIDKILIYFPAKISGADYFQGIQKQNIIDVLNFLKLKGYLNFNDVNEIYKKIFVKDLDIKCDFFIPDGNKIELKEYNKNLQLRFNGEAQNFHSFDSQKQGFGISTYKREIGTFAKPFIKFYDKRMELIDKNKDFLKTLPDALQNEILNTFIYRYEFTLKDKTFFDKFCISNRLEDIHEVLQEKWNEIGKILLNNNFQAKLKVPRDMSKLSLKERLFCLYFMSEIKEGKSVNEIKNKYLAVAENRKEKHNLSILFERIYYNSTIENLSKTMDNLQMVEKWDKFFGLI